MRRSTYNKFKCFSFSFGCVLHRIDQRTTKQIMKNLVFSHNFPQSRLEWKPKNGIAYNSDLYIGGTSKRSQSCLNAVYEHFRMSFSSLVFIVDDIIFCLCFVEGEFSTWPQSVISMSFLAHSWTKKKKKKKTKTFSTFYSRKNYNKWESTIFEDKNELLFWQQTFQRNNQSWMRKCCAI